MEASTSRLICRALWEGLESKLCEPWRRVMAICTSINHIGLIYSPQCVRNIASSTLRYTEPSNWRLRLEEVKWYLRMLGIAVLPHQLACSFWPAIFVLPSYPSVSKEYRSRSASLSRRVCCCVGGGTRCTFARALQIEKPSPRQTF